MYILNGGIKGENGQTVKLCRKEVKSNCPAKEYLRRNCEGGWRVSLGDKGREGWELSDGGQQ